LGARVKVTNIENGQTVIVVVNGHLSAHADGGIVIDISHRACKEFGRGRDGRAQEASISFLRTLERCRDCRDRKLRSGYAGDLEHRLLLRFKPFQVTLNHLTDAAGDFDAICDEDLG
jgi:hypothetical protein